MKIVLATRNRKKVEELNRMFLDTGYEFVSLEEFPGCPEVKEDRLTFRGNAMKKARAVARYTGLPALSDDSGLVVDALDGAPGVFSARYAGPSATDHDNVFKLLRELRGVSDMDRTARFVCVIAFSRPDGICRTFAGTVEGRILNKPRGENGFGYDPVFVPEAEARTFAQMQSHEKDSMSHRGRAITKLKVFLLKGAGA